MTRTDWAAADEAAAEAPGGLDPVTCPTCDGAGELEGPPQYGRHVETPYGPASTCPDCQGRGAVARWWADRMRRLARRDARRKSER